ncbi:hypothetical protein MNBD_GAMMA26-2208 [hydrothermal vent metagenome]|uniref:Serine protease n=1 Tax=hydrothermal vent metagenome TaxID=652676 RepID=A0A3B1BEY0_9ZZZZ
MPCLTRVLLLLLFAPSINVYALDPTEIFSLNQNSVGFVYSGGSQGSGVVIDNNEVVTNCHVISNYSTDGVKFNYQGKAFRAILMRGNQSLDLCVLNVAGLSAPPVKIREAAGF